MYKVIDGDTIQDLSSGSFFNPDGVGIAAAVYDDWLKAGNTPMPADPPDQNAIIRQQISDIETQTGVPAIVREALLGTAKFIAQVTAQQMTAAGVPTTAAQLLAQNIGYQDTLAVDNQIKELEGKLQP